MARLPSLYAMAPRRAALQAAGADFLDPGMASGKAGYGKNLVPYNTSHWLENKDVFGGYF